MQLVVCRTDKNLRPAIIERKRYIRFTFGEHLLDRDTYKELTQARADQIITQAHSFFLRWLQTYRKEITKSEATYLQRTCCLCDPNGKINYPQLYLLAKIHKTPLETQPIV